MRASPPKPQAMAEVSSRGREIFAAGKSARSLNRVRSAERSEDRSRSGVLLLEGFPQHVFQRLEIVSADGRDENGRNVRQFGADRLGQLFVEQIAFGDGQQTLLVEQLGVVLFQFAEQDAGTPRARLSSRAGIMNSRIELRSICLRKRVPSPLPV